MKLVMTLLVRDEEDVLREHLNFHLAKGVDEVILMDNLSTDSTREIAREFERSGCLHYVFQPDDDYAQGAWVTEMARRAYVELHADWVINSDADEFWFPHKGSLKAALQGFPANVYAASAERINFVGRPENGEPFWRRMNVRRTASFNHLGRPLPKKVAHRGCEDVVVAQGNHAVRFGDKPCAAVPAPIDILHYPVRSASQFRNKIVKGGSAYARNNRLSPEIGDAWRQLYAMHLEGRFDEACSREILSDEEIVNGLRSGELVQDERLINAMYAHEV